MPRFGEDRGISYAKEKLKTTQRRGAEMCKWYPQSGYHDGNPELNPEPIAIFSGLAKYCAMLLFFGYIYPKFIHELYINYFNSEKCDLDFMHSTELHCTESLNDT